MGGKLLANGGKWRTGKRERGGWRVASGVIQSAYAAKANEIKARQEHTMVRDSIGPRAIEMPKYKRKMPKRREEKKRKNEKRT